MLFNINNFQTIHTKIIFGGGFFRKFAGIEYFHEGQLYATLKCITKEKNSTLYESIISNGQILRIIPTSKSGDEFEIWDDTINWQQVKKSKLLSFSDYQSYKFDKDEIKYLHNGYGIMLYKNEDFIGRIKDKSNPLSANVNYIIDFADFGSIGLLMAICAIEIIKREVYRLHETGE